MFQKNAGCFAIIRIEKEIATVVDYIDLQVLPK